jgi:[acyl-carrier-protein] S-malonyltransferase
MQSAADAFKLVLDEIEFREPTCLFLANVTATEEKDPQKIKALLVEQLTSSVLWESSLRRFLELGFDTYYEIGPNKVLTGLLKKTDRTAKGISIGSQESLIAVKQ